MGNAEPAQQAKIRYVVSGKQRDIGGIRLQESVERCRFLGDGGNLKITTAAEGAQQKLRLQRAGIGDEHAYCLSLRLGDRIGFREAFQSEVSHASIMMPERVGTRCMPHHSGFVMNPLNLSTFGHLLLCTGLAAICACKTVAKVGNLHASRLIGKFVTFPLAGLCPVPR